MNEHKTTKGFRSSSDLGKSGGDCRLGGVPKKKEKKSEFNRETKSKLQAVQFFGNAE